MFCMSSIDQQFVEFIVKSLVSNPGAVIVERRIDEKGVLLELTVDPEDLGRVIGKRGATAQSLRTLLRALGTKNDARYNLKIVDNGVGVEGGEGADSSNRPAGTETSAAAGAGGAATTAATDDDFVAEAESPVTPSDSEDSGRISRTRRELQELDDLDV
jgi:uncharacterized protein